MTDCIHNELGRWEGNNKPEKCYISSTHGKKCKPDNCTDRLKTTNPQPVYDDDQSGHQWKDSMHLIAQAYHKLVQHEQHKLHQDHEHTAGRRDMGHFEFIARSTESLVDMLVHIKRHFGYGKVEKLKFLDCGCGIGNVVLLATLAGLDAYGLEYDEKTLNTGREFLKLFGVDGEKRLFQGDLLTFDNFGDYDILYGYCPMSNGELEQQFEHRLASQMKIGAMVFGLDIHKGMKCTKHEIAWFQRLSLNGREDWSIANPKVKIKHSKL
jgi:2-polyprenyl-3-methyl-5-hydroxy-6-metoxy-1,4-benzoquinol methylase